MAVDLGVAGLSVLVAVPRVGEWGSPSRNRPSIARASLELD